jgi:DNA-binding response OmpR family regulator
MKSKILIVTNELEAGLDLVMEIEKLGLDVVGLTDRAQDALEIAYLLEPDLALIEIGIPGALDGVHAAQLLRRAFEIPSIFVAASLDPATFARAEEAFPMGYLTQPHKIEELKASIAFALRQTRERKALRRTSSHAEQFESHGEVVPA